MHFEIPIHELSLRGSEASKAISKLGLLRPFEARNDAYLGSNDIIPVFDLLQYSERREVWESLLKVLFS